MKNTVLAIMFAILKHKHSCFNLPRDKFEVMVSNIEQFTTIVWTRKNGHESKGKVASEAMKLLRHAK